MTVATTVRRSWLLLLAATGTMAQQQDYSVELTVENYDAMTAGKTVFVKFFSPSCPHCQEMAPAWNKMAQEWTSSNSKTGLVGSVDCTTQHKICDALEIAGLPTLAYGDPSVGGAILQEYQNDKTYEELSTFANTILSKPFCSPANIDACTDDDIVKKKQMQYLSSLSVFELDSIIHDKENGIAQARNEFQHHFDMMQANYDALGTENELSKTKIKSRIQLLKAVQELKQH